MLRLIEFITPRRWWDWPIGVIFWGFVATFIAYGVEILFEGHGDEPFLRHLLKTCAIAAPLITMVLFLFQHLGRLQGELVRLAMVDPLTEIPNRRAFLEHVDTVGSGMMLMVDLDHFKRVNDMHGHAVGDDILRAMASHMRNIVGDDDCVGRLGGEEFAVFLASATVQDARRIGEYIARGYSYLTTDTGQTVVVTASVGAVQKDAGEDISVALQSADYALYAAKEAGRARVNFA